MVPLYKAPGTGKSTETENGLEVAGDWGHWGKWGVTASGHGVSSGKDENVLERVVGYNTNRFTVYFKWANCTACELHLNNAVSLKGGTLGREREAATEKALR